MFYYNLQTLHEDFPRLMTAWNVTNYVFVGTRNITGSLNLIDPIYMFTNPKGVVGYVSAYDVFVEVNWKSFWTSPDPKDPIDAISLLKSVCQPLPPTDFVRP